MTATFYSDLPIVEHFVEISNPNQYCAVPADWFVVLSDVTRSTEAIAAGRYKEVNFVGAATIVAVLNCARELELPFVFGGDGATLLIPPEIVDSVKHALMGVQALAKREYDFDLRIGLMNVQDVYDRGYTLAVAKFAITSDYTQAMLSGDGVSCVETIIKDPVLGARYRLHYTDLNQSSNLEGLECRWQNIPSRYGETVALLVRANGTPAERNVRYRSVLQHISATYGSDAQYHPVALENLQLTLNPRALWVESTFRGGRSFAAKLRYFITIWVLNVIGMYLIRTKRQTTDTDWARYPSLLQATTDYKKYDEVLRMVITGTPQQRLRLETALESLYQSHQIVYGMHVSSHALMTCIVFERMGRQVHFIDAADGGYARAAIQLKRRLRDATLVSPIAPINRK